MKLLLMGVALIALVGCSASVPIPTFTEQPTIAVSEPTPSPAPVIKSALPTKVSIPSIKAESSLIQTGLLQDRTLETPSVLDPLQASWYSGSPHPGDTGPAVILGHVDGGGHPGIFYRLRELKIGSLVAIDRADGSTVSFTIYKVEKFNKDAFPTDLVYGNVDQPEVRLITCGGAFDRQARSYVDNIVAFGRVN